jgi:D-alanyl-D-alanine-carboxypeptidase/D-alanyl-D-alanine-endopeptidase
VTGAPPPAIVAQAAAFPAIPADVELALRKRVGRIEGSVVVVGRRIGTRSEIQVIYSDGQRVGEHTRFEIGAITEAITGTLLADAVRRGELRLDEGIDERARAPLQPPMPTGKHITFRDLATHHSGLPRLPLREAAQPYASFDRDALIALVNGARPTAGAAAKYAPSNVDFALLGMLLADRTGTPYAELVRNRVFVPLNMSDTTADSTADDRVIPEHAISGKPVAPWRWNALAPAGGVRSTAGDLLNFASALFEHENGPLAQDARVASTPTADAGPNAGIGLGWIVDRVKGTVWASGSSYGSIAFLGVVPRRDEAVVVLSNVGLAFADVTLDDLGLKLLAGEMHDNHG